ncbi:MAG: hypothetical protein ACI85Q_000615 [Salibacteraceae bacterium]|jgi:hypothetical protein
MPYILGLDTTYPTCKWKHITHYKLVNYRLTYSLSKQLFTSKKTINTFGYRNSNINFKPNSDLILIQGLPFYRPSVYSCLPTPFQAYFGRIVFYIGRWKIEHEKRSNYTLITSN